MQENLRMITPLRFFLLVVLLVIVGIALWQVTYSSPGDRKDLRYQAWKLGLYPFDLDQATSTMTGDISPDRLVVGKTKEELIRKFGYVTPLEQASEYIKFCYTNSPYYGKQVLILRHSDWMVVMEDNHAVNLVLVKGC